MPGLTIESIKVNGKISVWHLHLLKQTNFHYQRVDQQVNCMLTVASCHVFDKFKKRVSDIFKNSLESSKIAQTTYSNDGL